VARALRQWMFQDWSANVEGKSRFILAWFRLAQVCRKGTSPFPRPLERLIDRTYRWFTCWFMATEIHPDVEVGSGVRIFHCHSIVLNPASRLGVGCTLRAGVCLGTVTNQRGEEGPAPCCGDGVDLGVGVLVIGPVTLGSGARVGAGAVVVSDVPDGATAVGNPARVLERSAA
jgi:serine acetyltransferase